MTTITQNTFPTTGVPIGALESLLRDHLTDQMVVPFIGTRTQAGD